MVTPSIVPLRGTATGVLRLRSWIVTPFVVLLLGLAAIPAIAQAPTTGTPEAVDNSLCLSCHEDVALGTGHGPVACASCHARHEEYPHPTDVARPTCASCHKTAAADHALSVHGAAIRKGREAADCESCHDIAHDIKKAASFESRKGQPDNCSGCHSKIVEQFTTSVHGKALGLGVADAPSCTSCHGAHSIRSKGDTASRVNPLHVRETCGQCHDNVALSKRLGLSAAHITSFDDSFHGMALKSGAKTVANCASCHGIHDILPSKDSNSRIHPSRLSQTCGTCHPGAGTKYAIGKVHTTIGEAGEPMVMTWVRMFYIIAIPAILGFMLVHNLGDWVRKLHVIRGRAKRPMTTSHAGEVRMYPIERVQHAVLAVSFIVLAWSGFALVWPDQWWASPLNLHPELRRWVHRIAAIAFMAVSFAHLFIILFHRQSRKHWMEMMPQLSDIGDAVNGFLYNVGLRKQPPMLPSHSYIEKAEYWAVVWGGVLMSATGLMLWANNVSLQYMPKEWLDIATAIHWYEAVLAAAAIAIWHFYGVIFDPDVYPLDTAFLTGRSSRKHGDVVDAHAANDGNGKVHASKETAQS